jgi:glutathione peroxidase
MSWLSGLGLEKLDGTPVGDSLDGKVLVVVNVASFCGYTPQYAGLEALHREAGDGVAVVGVPCNQFGAQEPGTAGEIATFCETRFGVSFPLLAKQDVNGAGRSALYQHLIGSGEDVKWNFEKFVVDASGKVVARFPSRVKPEDASLKQAVAKALDA